MNLQCISIVRSVLICIIVQSIVFAIEVNALRGAASNNNDDAICYAERYTYLHQKYCNGDSNECKTDDIKLHYQSIGINEHLIWGCRDRVTTPAKAVADNLSKADKIQIQKEELEKPLNLHVLIFETDSTLVEDTVVSRQSNNAGIITTVFGVGEHFDGFGSKWSVVLPALKSIPKNELVAIIDGRDVLLNIPEGEIFSNNENPRGAIKRFVNAYRAITMNKPGAVVMAAEAQCCVSALTHVSPGDYFDSITGQRALRSCPSGEGGCGWEGDTNKLPWEIFQEELAKERTGNDLEDVYLNSGTVAGRASDLINIIEAVNMEGTEDDQAVFTDFMYHRPDLIVLDYAQEMFGVTRWSKGMEEGCLFEQPPADAATGSLVHAQTQTSPLFLHTPGQFFECFNSMASKLQLDLAPVDMDSRKLQDNYGGSRVAGSKFNNGKKRQLDEGELLICHRNAKNGYMQTIAIDGEVLGLHLDYGDSVGPCPEEDDEVDAEDEDSEVVVDEEEEEDDYEEEEEEEEEEHEAKDHGDADDEEEEEDDEEWEEEEEEEGEEDEDMDDEDGDDADDELEDEYEYEEEDGDDGEDERYSEDDEEFEDEDDEEEYVEVEIRSFRR